MRSRRRSSACRTSTVSWPPCASSTSCLTRKSRTPSASPWAPCGHGFIALERCCNRGCFRSRRTMASSQRKQSLWRTVEREPTAAKRTADGEALAALQNDDERAGVPRLDLLDPIHVHDRGSVDAHEARRIEPLLEGAHALVQQIAGS